MHKCQLQKGFHLFLFPNRIAKHSNLASNTFDILQSAQHRGFIFFDEILPSRVFLRLMIAGGVSPAGEWGLENTFVEEEGASPDGFPEGAPVPLVLLTLTTLLPVLLLLLNLFISWVF